MRPKLRHDLQKPSLAGPGRFAETWWPQSEVDAWPVHDLKLVDSIALKVATIKQNLAKADDDATLQRRKFIRQPVDYALLKDISKESLNRMATCKR